MARARRRNISQESELIYDVHEFGLIIDTREIFLASDLAYDYDEAMLDHRSANQFIRNLTLLNNKGTNTILVHAITCGGDWNYGIAIYDAIKASCEDENSSDVVVLSHAHARSMSSIIPQAAKWRVIMPNADFLIHWGTLDLQGNHTSVEAEAVWAKRTAEKMLDIYVGRCREGEHWEREGFSEEDIRNFLREQVDRKQEYYMTSRQAVEMGFVDAVLGDEGFETIKALRDD